MLKYITDIPVRATFPAHLVLNISTQLFTLESHLHAIIIAIQSWTEMPYL
jgi:hypothetical protein